MNTKYFGISAWQRKNEYFSNIQTGHDIGEVKGLLIEGMQKQLAASMQAVNPSIASQGIVDEISRSREELNKAFNAIYDNGRELIEEVNNLSFAFEWGISEVIWQIEQSRKIAKEILNVLLAPLDTQAKELRKRAVIAYVDGLYEDALIDFQESIKKNRYDYMVHMTMGMIYTFHIVDDEKALESFEKAVKYSKPKSPYHASLGLMNKGMILARIGKIKEAEKATLEAISLSPELLEAHYQNAQYNAVLGNYREVCKKIEYIANRDYRFLFKASKDELFNQPEITSVVDKLAKQKRDEFVLKTKNKLSSLEKKFIQAKNDLAEINKVMTGNINDIYIPEIISQIKKRIQNNSIIDALKCNELFEEIERRLLALGEETKHYITKLDNVLPKDKASIEKRLEEISRIIRDKPQFYTYEEKEKAEGKFNFIFIFIAIILFIIGTFWGLRLFDSSESNWIMGVVFVIIGAIVGEATGISSIIRDLAKEAHINDLQMAKRNKYQAEIKTLNERKEKVEREMDLIKSIRKRIESL